PRGPIEFQIRTMEMHQVAEYGVAAHWAYKRGGKATASEKELRWINNLIELQEGAGDAQTFVNSVKDDIFTERIYVFTPDGAVRELPKDSVPIDFA
ncbi:bifunctional (p)ppGpp synthetase/guanosine-3',5'-bis(diphosphate) 3'-pyrophosphohydrolase, partial [Streptococcus suis]